MRKPYVPLPAGMFRKNKQLHPIPTEGVFCAGSKSVRKHGCVTKTIDFNLHQGGQFASITMNLDPHLVDLTDEDWAIVTANFVRYFNNLRDTRPPTQRAKFQRRNRMVKIYGKTQEA